MPGGEEKFYKEKQDERANNFSTKVQTVQKEIRHASCRVPLFIEPFEEAMR
jgi:hypothetical protein